MAVIGHAAFIGDITIQDGGPSISSNSLYVSDQIATTDTALYKGGSVAATSAVDVTDSQFVSDYTNFLGALSLDGSPSELAVISVGFFAVGGGLGAALQPRYSSAVSRLMRKWGR